MTRTQWLSSVLILAACAVKLTACAREERASSKESVTVFAAASAADVITEAARRFEASTATRVVTSFDSSSTLCKQILAGAPADVFLSSNQEWMDELESAGLVRAGSRSDLLANELVLIAPRGQRFDIELTQDFDLAARVPELKRLAIGDPSHVPAGRYAKQALESLGWWAHLEPLVIPTKDVRAALRLVEIGEADAAIVYATDAQQTNSAEVIAVFPPTLHDPITYPIARCSEAPAGAAFLEFLRSDEMKRVFENASFRVVQSPFRKET